MSNETKRDVFDKLLSEYVDDERRIDGLVNEPDQHIPELDREYFTTSYAAALPDDLPVILKAVGEYIQWCKSYDGIHSISEALYYATEGNREWIYRAKNSDAFARAWLLGVWRVDETGELVKLEAEK